jgi:hypothetical protein
LFSHHSETQRTARVRLASSLAAAALDGLFEHPAGSSAIVANVLFAKPLPYKDTFIRLGCDHSINARVQ